MHLVAKALTTCQVDREGDYLRLSFEVQNGRTSSVTLPIECAQSLLMTLPGMIERALKARHGDEDYRLVYPTGGWTLHAAAHSDQRVLTLQTTDGFKVAFSLSPEDADRMASSLANDHASQDHALAVN